MSADHRSEGVSPRSRLRRLTPEGVGTLLVESLTSYFLRLAAAHHLRPSTLADHVLGPALLGPITGVPRPIEDVFRHGHSMNGPTGEAAVWVQALGSSTSRSDLSLLTLRPWVSVLPIRHLVRERLAYCATCLDEFAERGIVFEPLVWTLQPVTVCPAHRTLLRDVCPHCRSSIRFLSFDARPGLCRRCLGWLGDQEPSTMGTAPQQRESELAAELVLGPRRAPTRGSIAAMVARAISESRVTQREFARLIDHAGPRVSSWRRGVRLPAIDSMVRICELRGWSLRAFLEGEAIRVTDGSLPEPRPRQRRTAESKAKVVRRIRKRLAQPGKPPTNAELCAILNLSRVTLQRWVPVELRTELMERRSQWRQGAVEQRREWAASLVRDLTNELQANGQPASRRRVEFLLPKPLSLREPALHRAWREARGLGVPSAPA